MHVSEIWRYPIKSLKGQRLSETQISKVGIPGDRSVVVIRALNGRILTSRVKPKMLGLQGGIGENGVPTVNGYRWNSEEALRLVSEAAGEEVSLEQVPAPQAFDILPLLVATDGSTQFLHIDHRRLRPNIFVAGVPGLEERGWEGKILAIGGVRMRAEQLRDRCVMTTFDPDTQVQDSSVLARIIRDLEGSTALDCSVLEPGTIRERDIVTVGDR
jgi:uncharacterized protein